MGMANGVLIAGFLLMLAGGETAMRGGVGLAMAGKSIFSHGWHNRKTAPAAVKMVTRSRHDRFLRGASGYRGGH